MSINSVYKFHCMSVLVIQKGFCMSLAECLSFGYIKMPLNLQLDLRRNPSIWLTSGNIFAARHLLTQ